MLTKIMLATGHELRIGLNLTTPLGAYHPISAILSVMRLLTGGQKQKKISNF